MKRQLTILLAIICFAGGYSSLPDRAYSADSKGMISLDVTSDMEQSAAPLSTDRLTHEEDAQSPETELKMPEEPLSDELSLEATKTAKILEVLYLLRDIPGHKFDSQAR